VIDFHLATPAYAYNMTESFSEAEVSMAEASSDPEPGPSTRVTDLLMLMFQFFYPGLDVLPTIIRISQKSGLSR